MEKIIKQANRFQNPYLVFLPFLIIYIICVLLFQQPAIIGDEERFLSYAEHLTKGYYAPPDHTLGHGPGYSIILVPFVALNLPLLLVKLLNALFYYLSVVYLYKALRLIVSHPVALAFALFWACYYNSLVYLHLIYSEILASFLITLLLYHIIKLFQTEDRKEKRKQAWLSGFILGYLVLVKVIFSYVILCLLAGVLVLWLFNKAASSYKKIVTVLGIAFLTISPYVFYTYNITGKVFYLSTTGGENLYWMTTHHEGEYGSWFPVPTIVPGSANGKTPGEMVPDLSNYEQSLHGDNLISGIADSIISRHGDTFREVFSHSATGVERDETFKRIAMKNLKENPGAFIKNCFSNAGRMLFNYPYSYSTQRPSTLLRFPLNGLMLVLMFFCIIPTLMNWRKVPFSVRFMLFFVALYLGGSLVGSAEIRMFSVIAPVLILWIAYTLEKSIRKIIIRW